MKKELLIEGMSCGHCVRHVENALKELAQISDVVVNLEEKKATISMKEAVDDMVLKEAVEEAGYTVTQINNA